MNYRFKKNKARYRRDPYTKPYFLLDSYSRCISRGKSMSVSSSEYLSRLVKLNCTELFVKNVRKASCLIMHSTCKRE